MIKNGTVVNLAYRLTNDSGEVLDQADAKEPFTYLHGSGQIVPGLENALEGAQVGDKKKVSVAPAEGYGEMNPELKLVVKRSQFPAGAKIAAGMQFQANGPEGEDLVFKIDAVEGDEVHIDGNHPLAGCTLHFEVEVLSMRQATEEELEHGHAHGEDGHHHH
jgi:FKBP-type peptidyl-prolyl cis-trans isomerase SlyD